MENKICIRCGKESDTKLPLCGKCRETLSEFSVLVEYLNSFTGSKEDLLWIIGSEISSRECSIISQVNVVNDFANGTINLVPIEPSSSTLKSKPWLINKYEHIKQTISEISKLRRANYIARQHFGTV